MIREPLEAPRDVAVVVAVVVAYQPEPNRFARLLSALQPQVAAVIVVDNGAGIGLEDVRWDDRAQRVEMPGNAGVAAAQNAGIRRAVALAASHVLLLDHDSVPAADMTAKLLAAASGQRARGARVAAVGPAYDDPRHAGTSPFVTMGRTGFRRHSPEASEEAVPVAFLISAGSLIGVDAIDAVGPMDERLFIDYIDVEWCLRARSLGWHCYGVPAAHMEHQLGDAPLSWRNGSAALKIFGRTLPSRSPLRHYYLFRNGWWLILRSRLPVRWKLLEAKRLFACFGAYLAFASPRGEQLRAMARGAFDGVRGRLGPA